MALLESLLLGFGVGLSGALAPGPTLLATISGAVRHGLLVGGRVAAGHLLVEGVLAIALVLGIAPLVLSQRMGIAVVGGAALVGFGLLTLQSARTASLVAPAGADERVGPFLAGVLTSVANPYFWLWWATLGGALLASALARGPGDAAFYLVGHGAADLGWLLLVGAAVARGSAFLPDRAYRLLLGACGVALVAIGAVYAITAL